MEFSEERVEETSRKTPILNTIYVRERPLKILQKKKTYFRQNVLCYTSSDDNL